MIAPKLPPRIKKEYARCSRRDHLVGKCQNYKADSLVHLVIFFWHWHQETEKRGTNQVDVIKETSRSTIPHITTRRYQQRLSTLQLVGVEHTPHTPKGMISPCGTRKRNSRDKKIGSHPSMQLQPNIN